jgi:hypothetical protein
MKSVFSRHGIPDVVYSDNGPQYDSDEFRSFAKEYGFQHITSSPGYPQSNGIAENPVGTVKNLLKKAEDPYLALLNYRNTPLKNGYSPAELLMGRRLKTNVPVHPKTLKPKLLDEDRLRKKEEEYRKSMSENYNRRHRAKDQEDLKVGDQVYIPDLKSDGTVTRKLKEPRSYMVQTPKGKLRRNRKHIRLYPRRQNLKDQMDQSAIQEGTRESRNKSIYDHIDNGEESRDLNMGAYKPGMSVNMPVTSPLAPMTSPRVPAPSPRVPATDLRLPHPTMETPQKVRSPVKIRSPVPIRRSERIVIPPRRLIEEK